MTKITILGEEPQKKQLTPIKVTKMICNGGQVVDHYTDLSNYSDVKIVKVEKFKEFDCVIIASPEMIFLGHFNDGIV
jgi:hypothetical protein